MAAHPRVLFLFLFFGLFGVSWQFYWLDNSRTISKLAYIKFDSNEDQLISFCVGRLNATHHYGCTGTPDNDHRGVPLLVNNSKSFDDVTEKVKTSETKHTLLIDIFDFAAIGGLRSKLDKVAPYLAGVIFYRLGSVEFPKNTSFDSYSHDSVCPNAGYGSDAGHCQTQWVSSNNPFLDFAHTKWPFPMFYVQNETVIKQLIACEPSNRPPGSIQCIVELKVHMHGAINSKRCLARSTNQFEQVLGGHGSFCNGITARSILAPLIPIKKKNETIPDKSVIILTARIDSLTVFDSFSPGANSVYSAVIVLMAVAKMLNEKREVIKKLDKKTNILFALFDGESIGYLGSSTFLYGVNACEKKPCCSGFYCQLPLEKISFVLELSQLLNNKNSKSYWIHSNQEGEGFSSELSAILKSAKPVNSKQLPPSTIRVFQGLEPKVPAFLLTGYESNFTDPFYHSLFDTVKPGKAKSIASELSEISNSVAKFLFSKLVGGTSGESIQTDVQFVKDLAECFFQAVTNCTLFGGRVKLNGVHFHYTTTYRSKSKIAAGGFKFVHSSRSVLVHVVRESLREVLLYSTAFQSDCKHGNYSNIEWRKVNVDQNATSRSNEEEEESAATNERTCLKSQIVILQETSPYFDDDNENATKWAESKEPKFVFSSVVESDFDTANQPAIILYVRPGKVYQLALVSGGILVFFFSVGATYLISMNAGKFFPPPPKNKQDKNAVGIDGKGNTPTSTQVAIGPSVQAQTTATPSNANANAPQTPVTVSPHLPTNSNVLQ